MTILIDMNLSPRWVEALAEAEISSVHWASVGPANASDSDIINFAREVNYCVLTQDLDFGSILALTRSERPSVLQIRSDDVSPGYAAPFVIRALRQMSNELSRGALVTVDPKRARVRYLPFL